MTGPRRRLPSPSDEKYHAAAAPAGVASAHALWTHSFAHAALPPPAAPPQRSSRPRQRHQHAQNTAQPADAQKRRETHINAQKRRESKNRRCALTAERRRARAGRAGGAVVRVRVGCNGRSNNSRFGGTDGRCGAFLSCLYLLCVYMRSFELGTACLYTACTQPVHSLFPRKHALHELWSTGRLSTASCLEVLNKSCASRGSAATSSSLRGRYYYSGDHDCAEILREKKEEEKM